MALPVEVLRGLYLGVLAGVLPALVAWSLGFGFRYSTGVTVPGFAVVALGVAIAGVNGGLLALNDEAVRRSPTLLTALLVVLMTTLYAHNRGDALGASLPRPDALRRLPGRRLPDDVVEFVGGRGRVRIRVAGDVADVEGHPPLPADLRAAVRDTEWTLPADLPLSELESRVAERLRATHELADVSVAIDDRGRATVAAAPPAGGLSRRVPAGRRAVSTAALVPTGLVRGDDVALRLADGTVEGTVVSARSGGTTPSADGTGPATAATERDGDGRAPDDPGPAGPTAPATTGGPGRVTVATDPDGAERVLAADRATVVVRSRGTRREFELVSLLRQAGRQLERLTVAAGGPLDGTTLGDAAVRDAYGVAVVGRRRAGADEGRWTLAPGGTATVRAGDELLVAGDRRDLARFREAVA